MMGDLLPPEAATPSQRALTVIGSSSYWAQIELCFSWGPVLIRAHLGRRERLQGAPGADSKREHFL